MEIYDLSFRIQMNVAIFLGVTIAVSKHISFHTLTSFYYVSSGVLNLSESCYVIHLYSSVIIISFKK